MVLFQVLLILSGNLSFLNWLTIVPALACFDDGLLGRLVPEAWRDAPGATRGGSRVRLGPGVSSAYALALVVAVAERRTP